MPAGRGRYTIVRKLAQGGMAEIFLATQHGAEGFERPVVLKRILSELSADPHFCNGLIDEAHIAMGLTHSNIVQVLDLGKSHKRYFLVMEFIDGADLNELIKRARRVNLELPPALALFVIVETCRALSYAHAKQRRGTPLNIVHRDISPHNILVSRQGEVKLTDFGIAKALNKRDKTATGLVKGKIAFMSPEQASGEPLDGRSDLFSLGSTLYAVVTGKRPFEAPTDIEVLLRVREAQFEAPEKLRPGLDPGLAAIIRKAMERSAADRYQSAEEMLVAAEGVLRTSLGGAGQTELKRWIAELFAREENGVPSAECPPPLPEQAEESVSISIELEEAEAEPAPATPAIAAPPPSPVATTAAPTKAERSAPRHLAPEAPAEPIPEPAPAPPARTSSFGRSFLAVALLGVAGFLGWRTELGQRLFAEPPAPAVLEPRPSAPEVSPAVESAGPAEPALAPSADAAAGVPDVGVEEPADAAAEPADAAVSADAEVVPDAVDAGESTDAGDEKAASPSPGGPDAAAPDGFDASLPPPPAPKAETRPLPVPNPTKASRDETVSVRVVSDPPGAAVRVEKTTFGVTPLSIRFRPAITYELLLAKDGYAPTKRLVHVADKANQVVNVKLPRKPAGTRPAPKSKGRP